MFTPIDPSSCSPRQIVEVEISKFGPGLVPQIKRGEDMSIHTVFEKWKHLDHLLSDREWLTTDDDGNTDIRMMILYESWQAIKTQMIETRIDSTPLISCHDCMWNYEGECNLSSHSGFQYEYDRYADDEDEHEFKPCKHRLEYFSFEEWFLEHYMELLK